MNYRTPRQEEKQINIRLRSAPINLTRTFRNYLHCSLLLFPNPARCTVFRSDEPPAKRGYLSLFITKSLKITSGNGSYPHSFIKNFLIVHNERLKRSLRMTEKLALFSKSKKHIPLKHNTLREAENFAIFPHTNSFFRKYAILRARKTPLFNTSETQIC